MRTIKYWKDKGLPQNHDLVKVTRSSNFSFHLGIQFNLIDLSLICIVLAQTYHFLMTYSVCGTVHELLVLIASVSSNDLYVQTCLSFCCSYVQCMDVDEGSDQNLNL